MVEYVRISNTIDLINKHLNLPEEKVIELFYKSKTYKYLKDKETHYYVESSHYIADEFLREINILPSS